MSNYSEALTHTSQEHETSPESERLKQLYETHILDTKREYEFDNLARMAASVCDMPIGMINFIDKDRQWSKSCIGVNIKEMKKEDAFCNQTIQNDEVLIIEDTLKDERFKENPYVVGEPYLRFYAGVNIKSNDGYNIGSICVMGHEPGSITEKELSLLRTLADEVKLRLDLRQKNVELQEKYDCISDLKKFLGNSADLMFKIDPETFTIRSFSSGSELNLGYGIGELNGRPLVILKPGVVFLKELNAWNSWSEEHKFEFETRLANKSGEFYWYSISIAEQDETWYVVAKDISMRKGYELDLKETNILFRHAQRIAKVGHWRLDPATGKIKWSEEIYNIMNKKPDSFDPDIESFMGLVHPDDREFVNQKIQSFIAGADIDMFKHKCRLDNGETIHLLEKVEYERNENGELIQAFGITQDITRLKEYENDLKQSLEEKELMLAEIHHRVKNNLALISGMIDLESLNTINKKVVTALESLSTRVQTMGLVHENLYQNNKFSSVPLHAFFDNIVDLNLDVAEEEKKFNYNVDTSPTYININQAVPFALAANHIFYQLIQNGEKEAKITLHETRDRVELLIGLPVKEKERNPFEFLEDQYDLSFDVFKTFLSQAEASYEFLQMDQSRTLRLYLTKSDKKGGSAARYFSK